MLLKFRQFITLSSQTTAEAIRQPICLILTISSLLFMALIPHLSLHQLGESGKLVRDSALAIHLLFGLLIGGHAASASITREMKSGTAAAILSKPVSRTIFFLSKFTGIAVLVVLYSICSMCVAPLAVLSLERAYIVDPVVSGLLIGAPFLAIALAGFRNHQSQRPFTSSAFLALLLILIIIFALVAFLPLGQETVRAIDWRILQASLLITLALVVMSSLSITFASRLPSVPALVATLCVFLIGLMSDYLFGAHQDDSITANVLYVIVPNWQNFWMADALTGGGHIPWTYMGTASIYALTYIVAILSAGLISFNMKEVK